jgi:hypothetical protein
MHSKIVLASGHMIDELDRKKPRFPPYKEEAVRTSISSQLAEWTMGPGDLAICGGARGTDMLVAELCVQRGADVWLCLAIEEEAHLDKSVRLAGSDWEDRYYALLQQPTVSKFIMPAQPDNVHADLSLYARNNLWMINLARTEAPTTDQLYALLVWDEKPTGDGPGGTSDFAQKVNQLGGHVAIINPTTL